MGTIASSIKKMIHLRLLFFFSFSFSFAFSQKEKRCFEPFEKHHFFQQKEKKLLCDEKAKKNTNEKKTISAFRLFFFLAVFSFPSLSHSAEPRVPLFFPDLPKKTF